LSILVSTLMLMLVWIIWIFYDYRYGRKID
jgi:hypothetical protein